MDTIEKQFVEYKTKKITIDQIYLNTKDDSEIEEELQKMTKPMDLIEIFLIEYSYLAKLN
jgi:hypothetical protein